MSEAHTAQSSIRLSPKLAPAPAPQAQDNIQHMDSYKAAHIETATPERLVVMLYDGAIKYLNLGQQGLEKKDFEVSHRNILKAEAIILELMSVLDMDVGGELAQNLYNLYDYMYRQLIQANIKRKIEPLKEVVNLLSELRGAWSEAADTVAQMRAEGKLEIDTPGDRSFAG